MKLHLRLLTVLISSILISSCVKESDKTTNMLNSSSEVFLKTSEKCLLDVRDRSLEYDNSQNCTSLGKIFSLYISAGGMKESDTTEARLKMEQGQKTAWMAKAISCSPGNRIW